MGRTRNLHAAPLVLAVGAGLLGASGARAESGYYARFGGVYTHDDNLFRQDKDAPQDPRRSRADDIYSLSGRGGASFNWSDYQATLTADAGYNWFRHNSDLRNLDFSLTGSIRREQDGIVGLQAQVSSDRRLSSFADVRNAVRNVQSLQRANAELTYPITPEFRIVLTPEFIQSKNSAAAIKTNDYRQYGSGAGLGYYTPLGNSVAVTVTRRYTKGTENRPVVVNGGVVNAPIDVSDTSLDLRLTYKVSPFTSISGIFSYLRRDDQSPLNNNYHGPSGSVTFSYAPTERVRAQVTIGRRPEASSYVFIDSLRTDYAEAHLNYDWSERVQFSGNLSYTRRRYAFDPIASVNQPNRLDRDLIMDVGGSYLIADRIVLGLTITGSTRNSSVPLNDYRSTAVQLSAAWAFGSGGRSPLSRQQ